MINPETVILVHRIVGYGTAFVVAPLALLAFATPKIHRKWGKAYFYLMLFLYITGSYFTFASHDLTSWVFARNLTFNFFGFSMVLYAYRAIRLFRQPGPVIPDNFDKFFVVLLTASTAALITVAVFRNPPMKIFSLAAIWICVLEWRDFKIGVWEKPLLFRRHIRYILASFFYVMTVVSVVHLKDELPNNARWLWGTIAGAISISLLNSAKGWRNNISPISHISQGRLTRIVVFGIVGLTALLAGYIVYDLIYGPTILGQG